MHIRLCVIDEVTHGSVPGDTALALQNANKLRLAGKVKLMFAWAIDPFVVCMRGSHLTQKLDSFCSLIVEV
jgi:hypothetical protein